MGIRSRIFFIVFVLLSISIAITYVVAERDLNNTFKQQTLNELEKKANLLVTSVGSLTRFNDINTADLFANELGIASNARITFIKNDGQVIGDSELDLNEINTIDNHGNRSEVIDALKNGTGWSSRYSSTLNQELLYFAIQDTENIYPNIIRISVPITYICLLYTSPSPRDVEESRMPSSA